MVLDNIRRISKERGFTLAEVCRRSDVEYDTLKKWNKVMPNTENLIRVADVLGTTLDELIKEPA